MFTVYLFPDPSVSYYATGTLMGPIGKKLQPYLLYDLRMCQLPNLKTLDELFDPKLNISEIIFIYKITFETFKQVEEDRVVMYGRHAAIEK